MNVFLAPVGIDTGVDQNTYPSPYTIHSCRSQRHTDTYKNIPGTGMKNIENNNHLLTDIRRDGRYADVGYDTVCHLQRLPLVGPVTTSRGVPIQVFQAAGLSKIILSLKAYGTSGGDSVYLVEFLDA